MHPANRFPVNHYRCTLYIYKEKALQSFLQWLPRIFSNLNFERIGVSHKIEEKTFPDYLAGRYYPMCIGEVLVFYYQVISARDYDLWHSLLAMAG